MTAASSSSLRRSSVVSTPHGHGESVGLSSLAFYERRPSSQLILIESALTDAPKILQPIQPEYISQKKTSFGEMPRNVKDSFHKAARDGDVSKVLAIIKKLSEAQFGKQLLKNKLDKTDKDGYTALHYAVRYGHGQITQLLIDHGADLNVAGDNGAQPIHLAARHIRGLRKIGPENNNEEAIETICLPDGAHSGSILKMLLDNGADFNARDAYMQTPLHYAALKGNIDAVVLLSNTRGIKIEAEDRSKATPLHSACSLGSVPVVNTLMIAGASFLSRDAEGLTPFHYAVMSGHLELLKDIISVCNRVNGNLELSALITDRDDHDQTALHHAVVSGDYNVCKLLLEIGSRVNDVSFGLVTPLHLAASNGNFDIVRLLLGYQADIEAKSAQGDTALHRASVMNREDIVTLLLDRGASVNVVNEDGCTPLMLAVQMDNTRIVHCLVYRVAARIDICDVHERSALFWAANENAMESLQVLLSSKDSSEIIDVGDQYDNTPLHVAATKGYSGIARILIEKNAKLDAVNDEDHTPLHLCAQSGHVRIVRQLLQKKPTLVTDEDEAANTPLHLAANRGHSDVIEALVDFGAIVVVRNARLWTPLDCAAANGHVSAARTLLERGSPVDPADRAKVTPLHLSSKGGYVEMTKLLLGSGADITLLNAEEKNCLDLAVDFGYKDTALAILDHRDWQSAMRHRTTEGGRITTPMRRIIEKLPAVALEVFNKCIRVGKEGDVDVVTLYYEFLDDTYAKWNLETEMYSNFETSDYRAFVTYLTKDGKESRYEKELDKKENHPLAIMVKHEQETLLSHPLVKSLLFAKWRSFGRLIYYSKLCLYCLFLFFLTCYAVVSPTGIKGPTDNITDIEPCANRLQTAFVCRGRIFVIILAGIQLLLEVIQLINRRLSYITSIENLTELLVFVFAIVYVTGHSYDKENRRFQLDEIHISIGSLAIFLAWVNLLLFLRKFPKLGIYFVMFLDVLKTFSLFSVTFSLFIVAFGLSFYLLLSAQPSFATPGHSIMKTIVMMIGEFEFDAIFNGDLKPYGVTWLIFGIFVVVMTIILMNLLVGLAVDDIKAVQDHAVLQRMTMQVDLVLDVEKFIPRRFRHHKFFQNKIKEVRHLYKQPSWIERIKPHPASLNAIEKAKKSSKETIEAVEENTKSLTESVAEIKSEINLMKSMMTELLQNYQNLDAVETGKERK